jgi:serine/threonine protein kinase
VLKGRLTSSRIGTPYYMSPEIWAYSSYDMKCDVWSLGCVLYEMTNLVTPFKASDFEGLSRKVKIGYFKPISRYYSSNLTEIILMMLKLNPR